LAGAGEFDEAREKWAEIIKRSDFSSPMAQSAFLNRIGSYGNQKEYQKAIDEIMATSPSLSVAPEFRRRTFGELADLYVASGKKQLALDHLKSLVDNAPDEMEKFTFMRMLAGLWMEEKRFDEAVAMYRAHLDANPDSELAPMLHWGVGSILRWGSEAAEDAAKKESMRSESAVSYEKAIELTRKALSDEVIEDNRFYQIERIANIYKEMGEAGKAVEVLSSFLAEQTDQALWLQRIAPQIAEIHFLEREFEKSKQWLQKLVDGAPGTPDAQSAAQAILQIDQAAKQEELLREQIALEKSRAETAATTQTLGANSADPASTSTQTEP
jgi:tetratricopeptide (TPR) repeat protein